MNTTKHTIFISRLPESATDTQVHSMLSIFGLINKVKLKMIKNGKTCAGYGFVELEDQQIALSIYSQAHNMYLGGHKLKFEQNISGITLNKYKEELNQRKVYLIGIPMSCKENGLKLALCNIAQVERVYVIKENKPHQNKNYGFAIFNEVEGAYIALKKKQFTLGKHKIIVKSFSTNKKIKQSFDGGNFY